MAFNKWLNVKLNMSSATGTAVNITGITKANPGVVTATAHGLTNGTYVIMSVAGMVQIHNRVFRVANTTANTFELEGENTTNYDTFTSGTATSATLGNSFGTIKTVNVSGGDADMLDLTTIHDSLKKEAPGLFSAIKVEMDSFWDLGDAALVKAKSYSDAQAQAVFLFTFATGYKVAMYGYVSASNVPTGSAGDMVMTKLTVSPSAFPTYYTT